MPTSLHLHCRSRARRCRGRDGFALMAARDPPKRHSVPSNTLRSIGHIVMGLCVYRVAFSEEEDHATSLIPRSPSDPRPSRAGTSQSVSTVTRGRARRERARRCQHTARGETGGASASRSGAGETAPWSRPTSRRSRRRNPRASRACRACCPGPRSRSRSLTLDGGRRRAAVSPAPFRRGRGWAVAGWWWPAHRRPGWAGL